MISMLVAIIVCLCTYVICKAYCAVCAQCEQLAKAERANEDLRAQIASLQLLILGAEDARTTYNIQKLHDARHVDNYILD
jgi:hypothetical protein